MNKKIRAWPVTALLLLAVLLSGCGEKEPEATLPEIPRTTRTNILEPKAPGTVVIGNEFASVDASCTQEGYIQVCYMGTAPKAKVQIKSPNETVYTYTLAPGGYETLPLTCGSGTYGLTVMENARDNLYAMVFSGEVQAEDMSEFSPYLYPNQYVWYTGDSGVYDLGAKLSQQSGDDLQYVEKVYSYVVENVDYDHTLAANVPLDYIPDVEYTLSSGKGICFDYASLMTALLRSQGIPTKLVVGYSGTLYHAWISVYIDQIGWVDGAIYFDGTAWSRLDPTLAAGNRGTSVEEYVNDSANYQERFFY